MTFDELMELNEEIWKTMRDAFARDDIDLYMRMAKLCEHINTLSLAIHMQNIGEAIQNEFEGRRPVL
jgi:hypothetical protein